MTIVSELGKIRSGFQLRGAAQPQPDGEHHVIQLGDVRDGMINWDRVIRMNIERPRPVDFVAIGDILLRSRGISYGAAVLQACPDGTIAAAPLYVLRLETVDVVAEYVVWFINRPATQSALLAHARGTNIKTVSIEAFADLEIILPAIETQHRILEMERLFDMEKELTNRHLEQRGQLIRAAQESLLSERF